MPLPKPLSEIKKNLEEFVADSQPEKALEYLKTLLPEGSNKGNQVTLVRAKLSHTNQKYLTGQIKFEDQKIEIAQVSAAILGLTNDLSEADFEVKSSEKGRTSISTVPKFVVIGDWADEDHCKMLNKHLKVLKITKRISLFNVPYDTMAGEVILDRARAEIADADYLLVLVTVDLFNSEWFEIVYDALMQGKNIVTLRIETVDIEGTGLEKLKSLPSMGRVISDFPNVDAGYFDIVEGLKKLLPK